MTFFRIHTIIFSVAIFLILGAGCGEPDRAEYRDMAAEEVCEEAESCDNLGTDGLYEDFDQCMIEEQSRFNSMWSSDECADGRINAERFDTCMTRALLVACDGGVGDWLAAADKCRASQVCID